MYSLKRCNFVVLQVTLYHLLKLFQTESALASGKKQLVSEFYDEIVSRSSCISKDIFSQVFTHKKVSMT